MRTAFTALRVVTYVAVLGFVVYAGLHIYALDRALSQMGNMLGGTSSVSDTYVPPDPARGESVPTFTPEPVDPTETTPSYRKCVDMAAESSDDMPSQDCLDAYGGEGANY